MSEEPRRNISEEQRLQAEARARRLAKIGMLNDNSAAAGTRKPAAPVNGNTVSAGRPNANTPQSISPSGWGRQMPQRGATGAQNRTPLNAQSPRRPNGTTAPSGAPRRNPASQNISAAGNAHAGRPVQQERRPVKQPARTAANNRPADGDERQFKKHLSDEESRAMMFSLTGKAENPSYGGDVYVIDTGRIPTGKNPKSKKRSEFDSYKKKNGAGTYIGRFFIVLLTLVLFVVVTAYATIFVIAHGPSESMRDLLVMSAEQASATKWVPYLVLSKDTVHKIISKSEEVVQDEISLDDYNNDENSDKGSKTEDEWAKAKDEGVLLDIVKGSTFKAYVMLVKDPAKVFVGTSTDDFTNATAGVNIFQAAARYDALACINGGEFLDNGGHGSGYAPLGLTFSKGECVFDDGSVKTFMGFTSDNKLIVRESMTAAEARELGIRDAVSFQNGNTLIEKKDDKLVMYYEDSNTGTSQRSAIGQREDGTVILIVTDGRTASSLGATHNDMIDLMVSYGAVSAGMLDGGSSAMMYYENYFDKFGIDRSTLDEYQAQGLVNNYKAFTEPRRIPSFFMVSK